MCVSFCFIGGFVNEYSADLCHCLSIQISRAAQTRKSDIWHWDPNSVFPKSLWFSFGKYVGIKGIRTQKLFAFTTVVMALVNIILSDRGSQVSSDFKTSKL